MDFARTALGAAVAGALALPVVLAGCGSGGGTTTTTNTSATVAWAEGVCAATAAYKSSIESATSSVKGGSLSKDALQTAADSVRSSTDTYISTLKGLGTPGSDAGKTAKKTVDELATSLKQDAQKISDASSGSALEAVSVVSTTLVSARDQISSAVDELEKVDAKGELKDAFAQAPSCASLKGGSG